MRFPHRRMSVTRRDEKELRLGAFISRGLGAAAGPQDAASPPAILVMARTVQSPVVRSVSALAGQIAAAGGSIRIILAKLSRGAPGGAGGEILAALQDAARCQVRQARNPRLIEAHEQLVIAARICWTGDSMRRDPAISDAYESFVEDCPAIATSAAATFERLWGDCVPVLDLTPACAMAATTPKAIDPPGIPGAANVVRPRAKP